MQLRGCLQLPSSVNLHRSSLNYTHMKKIHLSIPTPCHENWDGMTPQERGRFCGSCQKTVIDFSNLSDRQIAEFFKKPVTDTCGRFHTDQLHRDIEIPRKRIPWVRYFFQFTWPAWVLFLKSCTQKTKDIGKIQVEYSGHSQERKTVPRMATLGFIVPEITPLDTLRVEQPPVVEKEIREEESEKLLKEIYLDKTVDNTDSIKEYPLMDPVKITTSNYGMTNCVIMGGFTSARVNVVAGAIPLMEKESTPVKEQFNAYPNPVRAGSLLTISYPENEFPERIDLLSSSGQLITSIRQQAAEYATVFNLSIPSSAKAGLYFVRVASKEKVLKTMKLVVM